MHVLVDQVGYEDESIQAGARGARRRGSRLTPELSTRRYRDREDRVDRTDFLPLLYMFESVLGRGLSIWSNLFLLNKLFHPLQNHAEPPR